MVAPSGLYQVEALTESDYSAPGRFLWFWPW